MAGQPISITGAGPGGTTLYTTIIDCAGGAAPAPQIAVLAPVGAAVSGTQTVTVGPSFSALDISKSIYLGQALDKINGFVTTIAGVTNPYTITVARAPSVSLTLTPATVIWGHDDSTAVCKAATATLNSPSPTLAAAGLRYMTANGTYFVPNLYACLAITEVVPIGSGRFLETEAGIAPLAGSPGSVRRFVYPPFGVPQGQQPPPLAVGPQSLPNFAAAGAAPVVAYAADSQWTLEPNGLTPQSGMVAQFSRYLENANPQMAISFDYCAVGGQGYANLDTTPTVAVPPCAPNTTTPWLGTDAVAGDIYNSTTHPNLVVLGFTNNDGILLNASAFFDVDAKMRGWAYQADRIYATHWSYSIANQAGGTTNYANAGDYAAGFIESWAEVNGWPVLSFWREGTKRRDGFDPRGMKLVRRLDVSYIAGGGLGLPYTLPFFKPGMSAHFYAPSTGGAAFWSARGNAFGLQRNLPSGNVDTVWLVYNAGSGLIGYECDVSDAKSANIFYGAGCKGNFGTGAPATRPSILTSVAIVSGQSTLTTGAALFATCPTGQTIAVPGAGSGSGFGAGYLVATVSSCNSSTQAVLSTTALSTVVAGSNQFILYGNPVTNTAINDSATVTEFFSISWTQSFGLTMCMGDGSATLNCNQNTAKLIYNGPEAHYGGAASFTLVNGNGGASAISIAGDNSAFDGTSLMTEEPILAQPTATDAEVNGPSSSGLNNIGDVGLEGSEGNNHPVTGWASSVVEAVLKVNNWAAGFAGIYYNTPLTGFSITVPASTTRVQLTPAGSLSTGTVTLPSTYPPNTALTVASTQSVGTLTVNGSPGQTVTGAPTSLAANVPAAFICSGCNTPNAGTWYRSQ